MISLLKILNEVQIIGNQPLGNVVKVFYMMNVHSSYQEELPIPDTSDVPELELYSVTSNSKKKPKNTKNKVREMVYLTPKIDFSSLEKMVNKFKEFGLVEEKEELYNDKETMIDYYIINGFPNSKIVFQAYGDNGITDGYCAIGDWNLIPKSFKNLNQSQLNELYVIFSNFKKE